MRVFYQSYAHFLEPCAKRIWMLSALFAFLLSGCDSERDKEWKKWRTEISKVDYRCGTIGEYELKINKAYLFHWPVYEGRSDWESKPPPPISCSAKLDMMPIEAYWPGMKPAGRRPLSITIPGIKEPDYLSISVRRVPRPPSWSVSTLLNFRLMDGDDPLLVFGKNVQTDIGLSTKERLFRNSPLSREAFYWENGADGSIDTFIECDISDNGIVNSCMQSQYLQWLGAVLEIKYQRPQLDNWKVIASDVENFIKKNSIYKGS